MDRDGKPLRILLRWTLISLLVLGNTLALGLVALVAYARHVTAPTRGGISASEFLEGLPTLLIVGPGVVGLLALALTSLYWLVGLLWIPTLAGPAPGRIMRISLIFVPLWLTGLFAILRLISLDLALP